MNQVWRAQAFSARAASRTTTVWLWTPQAGEPLAVEGAFELGVQALGVLAHAVEPLVAIVCSKMVPAAAHSWCPPQAASRMLRRGLQGSGCAA